MARRLRYLRWYERMESARDGATVKEYATWLSQLQWQVYVTFTFAWRVSDDQAHKVFMAFIRVLERELRAPITFVRGDEKRWSGCGKPGSPRHYHVLMTSSVRLDSERLRILWLEFGGSGRRRFDGSRYVQDSAAAFDSFDPQQTAEYCLKFVNEADGDWMFGNLDLFMLDAPLLARSWRRAYKQACREAEDWDWRAVPRSKRPRLGLVTGRLPRPRLVRRREAAGASPA